VSLRRFHGAATIAWAAMIPVAVVTSLKDSVPFLVSISLWALTAGHWAAFQQARQEERQP
jgi:hypothetical protein